MKKRVFVAMPFGKKEGIDFDKVYHEFIEMSLKKANFDVHRADKETRAGNIRSDMFQELLLADLVVVDLSIDNPNVWYELGVRHALRSRGVIHIKCKRDFMPFDVYTDRALTYHINKKGEPHCKHLESDKERLATMAIETLNSWYGYKMSPVYQHLPYLKEPDWKSLRVERAKRIWEKFEEWENRIKIARKKHKPGDIMVLADEAPTRTLAMEAFRTAGKELRNLGAFCFALEQIEKALAINPEDLKSRQQKGILLGRLKKREDATVYLEDLIQRNNNQAENNALLGRVQKEIWIDTWRDEHRTPKEMREIAAKRESHLREAIKLYENGFKIDPRVYYPGINAVTLRYLLHHLVNDKSQSNLLKEIEGGGRWAVKCAIDKETTGKKDYWARVTLAELEVLSKNNKRVCKAYRDAVVAADNNWFALDSSLQQLVILRDLEFRNAEVKAAMEILEEAKAKIEKPWNPKRVFLFSGHMIDKPGRKPERFPPVMKEIAAKAIRKKLEELNAGPDDLAMCGGACGGDLLFAEAALERGIRLELRIPFDVPTFLANSVSFAGEEWRNKFYSVTDNPNTILLKMPEELSEAPETINPYVRNNLWQLYTALAWGPEKVNFIGLWNGKGGDGPGGTQHMHDGISERSGHIHVIDTNLVFQEKGK